MAASKRVNKIEIAGGSLVRFSGLLLFLAWAIVLSGCSSAPSDNKPVDAVMEPGVTQPPPPDPNIVSGSNPRDPQNRKPRAENPPGPPPQPVEPKPGPENSEISTMMNEDGSITEFRFFKDHPLLARVEANWMDPRVKTLKVYLKNGRVLEAKTDKIPYLHEAKSDLILSIVGVTGGAAK